MFNSREYEYADITVFVGGRDIIGLRGIEYKESQEKEAIYGKGNMALSIQKGNIKYEGKVTVLQSELLALERFAKLNNRGSLMGLDVNIIVSYGNPSKGDVITIEKLIGCQFTESTTSWKQGDKNSEHELPFIFLRKESI